MTVRLSHKKRPPFLFSTRARVNQLVCAPRPYVRAWAEDGRPLWAPCLAWSPGPVTLASTGDGSYQTLFGENWLAQICQDGTWVLYKRIDNEVLEVVPWDVVPPTVSITARHLTLAFDQGARPSVAWEDANGIRLREYDETTSQYVFIGPFDGVDPTLINDATINRVVGGSDVVLWYLSSDRMTLCYRIQSENFAIEHEHHAFDAPVVLDAADVGAYRLQLRVSDANGSLIPATGGAFQAVISDLYPVHHADALTGTGAALEGEYERGAWSYQQTEQVVVSSAAMPGEYTAIVVHHAASESLAAEASALEGAYVLAARRYEHFEEADVTAAALEGEYAAAAIRREETEAPLLVTATALEGAYAPA